MSDILLAVSEGVATLTLNRPDKRNAVRHATWQRLRDACGEIRADRDVRAVVLTGAGPHFCAGAEAALADLPQPTIAAIAGYCLGGGLSLSLCCDLRVADRSARFSIPAARLSVVYSLRGCTALYNAVGLANAKRIMFTADRFDAQEAHEMGLIDRLVDADPLAEARALARRIAENAPLSLAGCKFVLNAIGRGEAARRAQAIRDLQTVAHTSHDHHEAARAFSEKRKPVFQGR